VGTNLYNITDFINYAGRLLVGKENGIWDIDDQDLAREYTRFEGQEHPENCKGWAVWSGMLFIPIQETSIWRWTATNYREVGPSDVTSGPTAKWPCKITRLFPSASKLWAAASPQTATGFGGLMCYNGMGWHSMARQNIVNYSNKALFITTELGSEIRVWFACKTRPMYVKLSNYTNNRFDDPVMLFDNMGGIVVTSWWDGGLKDALKFWNRLNLIADIPTHSYIEIWAAKDGEDWETTADFILVGVLHSDDLSDDGEYSLMFPDGMVAKSIQLIFYLRTGDNDETPRIRAYNIESLVRQQPVDAYSFRILLADNITKMDGTTATRSANTMWEDLKRARAKNAPVIVAFPGKAVRGMISQLEEMTYRYKPLGTSSEVWERTANVTVIEAT